MIELAPQFERIIAIFHPFMLREWRRVNSDGTKFVHYTNAETATNILKTERVWMRNASCMNDFSEVEHGLKFLIDTWKGPTGQKLRLNLDAISANLSEELGILFDRWAHDLRQNSFLSCVSEQGADEYLHGRLSMWRAYGGSTGIALIMNNQPFLAPSDALGAYTSPVLYADQTEFEAHFREVSENIENAIDFLRQMGRDEVINRMFGVLRTAVLCTKHPGFKEEREWRVIYTDGLGRSDRIEQSVEVVRGVPQSVRKIPLRDIPDEGLHGISLPELIYRVLIGPTDYMQAVRQAFIQLLSDRGVVDAGSKVWTSGIPLR